MAFDKSKFISRFIVESREHIKALDGGLSSLNDQPDNSETLNAVFRSAHTIKGSSKMMRFPAISKLAHAMEDALDAIRQQKIQYSKELYSLFLKGLDTLSEMLDSIEDGNEISEVPGTICEDLESALSGEIKQAGDIKQAADQQDTAPPAPPEVEKSVPREQDETIKPGQEPPAKPEPAILTGRRRDDDILNKTIRISTDKLDEVIKLMGEIVTNHTRIKQHVRLVNECDFLSAKLSGMISSISKSPDVSAAIEEISNAAEALSRKAKDLSKASREALQIQTLLTSELQDKSLKMRMLPLSYVFDPLHRTVRELSKSSGKDIRLTVKGDETELDKKILEQITDPLTHMLRNAADHGIEPPDIRRNTGKPSKATITITACYEGNSAFIEVSDDGDGIDTEKIKEKIIQKKLYDENKIDSLEESELINFIFHPGFSTSDIITDISGRGVGMDVVKENIVENLKGSIQVNSAKGKGTTFTIRLPLTISVMKILHIKAGDIFFAIPSNFTSEILRLPESEIIDVVGKKAIRLREQIIPVVNLADVFGINGGNKTGKRGRLIIIVAAGNEKMGLVVDDLFDEEDAVIESLPSHMKMVKWVSGAIITGKNDIINVLHIPNIMASAKRVQHRPEPQTEKPADKKEINILIVDDSISTREIEKSILESYGYNVSLAGDGIEAFEAAMEFKYDLVVTDVEMPRMDGFSLTEKLKNDTGYLNTPVILVTSRDKESDKRRGVQVGADAYIVKGDFDQTNLLDTIRSLVG